MKRFPYQRMVLGYHGCDKSIADGVLAGNSPHLRKSQNQYDWIGPGIYFWEHGPTRALEWAEWKKARGEITTPAVIGAVIHLGRCFDLLDTTNTGLLKHSYPVFCDLMRNAGQQMPSNRKTHDNDNDLLYRDLDCSVITWTLDNLAQDGTVFDSVRGVFQEGLTSFPDSGIRLKSHIQIAVRDESCILGYFKPAS